MTIEKIVDAAAIYLDSNICIYHLEGDRPLQAVSQRLFAIANEHATPLVASELALAGRLYGAYKSSGSELAERYRAFFRESAIDLFPIDMPTLEAAAIIGPEAGVKLPDAIHIATALGAGCEVFVTNDARIRERDNLRIVQLSALIAR
jgi:predicted nucleic acid-binding protein